MSTATAIKRKQAVAKVCLTKHGKRQSGIEEAMEDIRLGRVTVYDNVEDLINEICV